MIEFLRGIMEMGAADSLEKSWLARRGGERGETSNSDVVIYGDGDNRKKTFRLTGMVTMLFLI